MKVKINYDTCASTGSCMQVCPEVFEVRKDGYLYILGDNEKQGLENYEKRDLPDALVSKAQEAADLCPTGSISLVE